MEGSVQEARVRVMLVQQQQPQAHSSTCKVPALMQGLPGNHLKRLPVKSSLEAFSLTSLVTV
jgi:hypothetical protein